MIRPTIVFDVNETLLDLRGLNDSFEALFGTAEASRDWFKQLLQLALLSNVLNDYDDFSTLGRRALVMTAQQRKRQLGEDATKRIAEAIRTLGPHPDVVPALERLRNAGFRIVTLTNSAPDVLKAQIENARIGEYFDELLSVDAVQRYKPDPDTYRYAARTLGVPIGETLLVAAHGWDVTGAMRAGARAAFVARPGQVLIPDFPVPEIVADTLPQVAEALVQRYA